MKVSIGQATKALRVSISTLQRWEKEGKVADLGGFSLTTTSIERFYANLLV